MVLAEIFGPDLLVVVLLAAVLIFGADRLPKIVRNLGEASREFKKAAEDADDAGTAPSVADAAEDSTVTLTRDEFEALITEREATAQRDNPGANSPAPDISANCDNGA
jgi:sec-independent protein translocase protein TatA